MKVPVGEGAGRAVGADGRHGDDGVGASVTGCGPTWAPEVVWDADTDLRIVACAAEPGTEDASRFDLIRTLGTVSVTPA